MPGCHIGAGVAIGANSVVTKDFPSYVIVAGVPPKSLESESRVLAIVKAKVPVAKTKRPSLGNVFGRCHHEHAAPYRESAFRRLLETLRGDAQPDSSEEQCFQYDGRKNLTSNSGGLIVW